MQKCTAPFLHPCCPAFTSANAHFHPAPARPRLLRHVRSPCSPARPRLLRHVRSPCSPACPRPLCRARSAAPVRRGHLLHHARSPLAICSTVPVRRGEPVPPRHTHCASAALLHAAPARRGSYRRFPEKKFPLFVPKLRPTPSRGSISRPPKKNSCEIKFRRNFSTQNPATDPTTSFNKNILKFYKVLDIFTMQHYNQLKA